jgi:GntR family transcriptional regulator/MocR family aminotransferase
MNFPLTLDFTPKKIERHRDLTEAARKAILQGGFKGGQRLPSAKELACQVGVSRSTVVKVYQQLAAEGYVETKVGSGTYLKDIGDAANLSIASVDVNADADVPVRFAPPIDILPGRQWQQQLARQCRSGGGIGGAGVLGYRPLRRHIAEYLQLTKAVKCTADQVIVFPGAQAAIYFITSFLMKEGDLAVVENPGDATVRSSLMMAGATVKSVGVDSSGLQVEDLEEITQPCKLIHVTPSHHFPTGAIMPMKQREALLDWARKADTLIVEDARDSDYYYGRGALPSLQGLDESGSVIYLYDFSLLLHPFVNLAVLVLPDSLIELAKRAMVWLGLGLSSMEHFALADFIAEGDLQRHIRRSRAAYQHRRQTLIFHLSQQFLKAVSIPSYGAGLYQLVRFELPLLEEDLLKCAVLAGLPMVPTRSYYDQPAQRLEFLIPFCMLEAEATAAKVARFKELVEMEISRNFAPAAVRTNAIVVPNYELALV